MALDLSTKANIRRHLGLPAAGLITANTTMGLRTVTRAGQLEFYMNVLQIEEESILLGRPYGALLLNGPLATGAVLSVLIGAALISYTVQVTDNQASDPLMTIANNFTLAIQAVFPTILGATASLKSNPFIPQPPYQTIVAQISLQGLAGPFQLSSTTLPVIANGASYPSPQYIINDGNGVAANSQVAYGLLPVCDALEQQLLASAQNLGFTAVGAVSTGQAVFRPDELGVRWSMLARYRRELGRMLSFYPANSASGIRSGGIEV